MSIDQSTVPVRGLVESILLFITQQQLVQDGGYNMAARLMH